MFKFVLLSTAPAIGSAAALPVLAPEKLEASINTAETITDSPIAGVVEDSSKKASISSLSGDIAALEKKLGELLLKKSNLTEHKTVYTEIQGKVTAKLSSIDTDNYKIEKEPTGSETHVLKSGAPGQGEDAELYLISLVSLEAKITVILDKDEVLQKLTKLPTNT